MVLINPASPHWNLRSNVEESTGSEQNALIGPSANPTQRRVMTEASGTSIDDLVIEKQNSFIAKSVSDWVSLGEIGGATGSGSFDRFSSW